MDAITITPIDHPLNAVVDVPGSKSITNRALLLAALAQGESVITNALFSEDTHWFSTCLKNLGFAVSSDEAKAEFWINGQGGTIPNKQAELFVGNAGTAARFITAMLALGNGAYRVDGVPRMRERPLGELLKVLRNNGADFEFAGQPDCIPFTIISHGFKGGTIHTVANQTSQQVSALLMIAPYANLATTIKIEGEIVSKPYLLTTTQMMQDWGVHVEQQGDNFYYIAAGQRYQPRKYIVEPDASGASYFFAAAAVAGGTVRVNHLNNRSVQGDTGFVDILAAMGCQVTKAEDYIAVTRSGELNGVEVDMNAISDTMPTLAAIAPYATSPVTIRNVEHVRWKETDRINAVVTELRRMGIIVDEFNDGLKIYPGTPAPAAIETYDDHRMAMAFAVTGLKAAGITITNPACTAKTFPDFFERFAKLGLRSL